MVNRFGKVDDGTTVTDFDEEEIARKHTLSASLAYAEWNKHKINLIDTPGIGNFLSDARAALQVADAAVGRRRRSRRRHGADREGVGGGARSSTCREWSSSTASTVSARASNARSQSLRDMCSRTVIPIQLPIGEETSVQRRRRSRHRKAFIFQTDESGKFKEEAVPADMTAAVEAAREALIEMVAEADEKLMEKFFEAGTLTDEELVPGLRSATIGRQAVPAGLHVGDGEHRRAAAARRHRRLRCRRRPNGRSTAIGQGRRRVSRVRRRKGAGRGVRLEDDCRSVRRTDHDVPRRLRARSSPIRRCTTRRGTCRSASAACSCCRARRQTAVPEIKAGDLGAVAKLKDTLTNDTLGDKSDPVTFPPITFPEPVLAYAIEPKSRGDEDKISTSMHRLEEEDPSIRYSRDPQTKELLLAGQGQLHIEVTVAKLKRRFGVDVNLKPPRIPYRETIKASTEAHGRHKKQTGGHGQFGDCKIKVEPLPRGTDFEFVDDIFGGSIPRQFVPAVEKGIQDARTRGYLAGYPMVDFRVTVFDGSYHDVDSNELSFKMAGSLAFKDAMTRARPTILEPIMNVEVYAPSDFAGDLMGDLNGRRGRIGGMDTRGAMTIIKAQVPMAEMLTYEQHLTSATGGRGSYHMEYSHYDEVPAHLQTKIIAAAKAERAGVEVEEV